MVDWQVTATTVRCDAVDDEVTIMVFKDWSSKCTGHQKYADSREEQLNLVKRGLQVRRTLECEGVRCTRIAEYGQKLQDEEAMESRATQSPTAPTEDQESGTDE